MIYKIWLAIALVSAPLTAQSTFTITGTAIPSQLLKLNYGTLPKGVQGFDINLCNTTDTKNSITSSAIYTALMESDPNLRPIGRQIMLAAITRNQNHSLRTILSLGLGSTTGVLSVIGQGRSAPTSGAFAAVALGALIGQQLLATWSPVMTADQVNQFEAQVLESALVMDGGSCVERTIFATSASVTAQKRSPKQPQTPAFQVRVR